MTMTHGVGANEGRPALAAALANPCLFDLASLDGLTPAARPPAAACGEALFRAELVTVLGDLRRFARRLAGATALADDLVQETYRRALECRHQFHANSELRAWMFRILRNIHIDLLRRASHEVVSGVEGDDLVAEPPPERPVWDHLSQEDVASALGALPPAFARTYVMYAVERRSYADIARELDVPVGTVGTRLRRARLQLRQVILERMPALSADVTAP